MNSRLKTFLDLDLRRLGGFVILLDIDGTLVADGSQTLPAPVIKKIKELGDKNRVILCSNKRDWERIKKFSQLAGTEFIIGQRKPWFFGIKKQLKGPLVVIGDKFLTDGLLAKLIGAKFIKVKRIKVVRPFWQLAPAANRRFSLFYSLPRTLWSSFFLYCGLKKIKSAGKTTVMTFSISEDYARLWYHFIRKHLNSEAWHFLIVDCAGDFNPKLFPKAQVVRFLNIGHGRKIDFFLKRIDSEIIFLCDDDKYLIDDISEELQLLEEDKAAVVSLAPRLWYKFDIGGATFLPMGTYSLLIKKELILNRRLNFYSPPAISPYKKFPSDSRKQSRYDTGDYLNEQLLLHGHKIVVVNEGRRILGWSGLSSIRHLLFIYNQETVKNGLLAARHFQLGSINGDVIRTLYNLVKFEEFFSLIFKKQPRFFSGFTAAQLRELASGDSMVMEYFAAADRLAEQLKTNA